MGVLENPRHERFAQGLAVGKNATEAYEAAGYDGSGAAVSASRLLKNANIQERVNEILGRAAARVEISAAKVLEELGKIGFSNMLDYVTIGTNGEPFVDLSALDRNQAAAIQEVTVEDFKDGRGDDARDVRRVKFKLADKRAALVDIGKHLGMFVDRSEVGKPGEFETLTVEQKRERVIGLAKQMGLDRIGPTAGSA